MGSVEAENCGSSVFRYVVVYLMRSCHNQAVGNSEAEVVVGGRAWSFFTV